MRHDLNQGAASPELRQYDDADDLFLQSLR
jgi:hypothetical protein